MSHLVAIVYPDRRQAIEVMATLRRLENETLLNLSDAVYVTKDYADKIHVRQTKNVVGKRALIGGFWGVLIGTLFATPLAGAAIVAAGGALSARYRFAGIDETFAEALRQRLEPGGLALVLMIRHANADAVIAEISRFGGSVLDSTLSPDREEQLRQALAENQGASTQTPIGLHAAVQCSDGPGGRKTRLVVDPATATITHVVVKEPGWRGVERIVPIEYVAESGANAILLRISRAELAELPSYEITERVTPEINLGGIYSGMHSIHSPPDMSFSIDRNTVAGDKLVVRHGAWIEATNGRIGAVDDILAGEDGVIAAIMTRRGYLWDAREVVIPIGAVARADEGAVYLHLSVEQVDQLEIVLPDEQVTLLNHATGEILGRVNSAQFQVLVDHLEEEHLHDDTYYINKQTLELLGKAGADAELLALLQQAIAARNGLEIRWQRE